MTSSRPSRSTAGHEILYVCDFNGHGGTQTHLLQMFQHIDRSRFRPRLATLNLHPALAGTLKRLEVPVFNLELKGAFRFGTLQAVRRLGATCRRENVALVHGLLFQGNIVAWRVAASAGIPLITGVRNMDLRRKRWHRRIGSCAHRKASAVLFNSVQVRDDTVEAERLDSRRAHVIYNGVEVPDETPARGAENRNPVVVCVASFLAKKDHATLLQAFHVLLKRVPSARLVLVGEGPLRESLEEMIRRLGVGSRVEMTGYCADMASVYARADISVLSSLEEGMPNVLLESMASGLPVVATDVGGNRELVDEAKTGFLVPPSEPALLADRLLKLTRDPEMRFRMGQEGRLAVTRRFSLSAMVESYQVLYDRLLEEREGKA